jgi:hypothetical protein
MGERTSLRPLVELRFCYRPLWSNSTIQCRWAPTTLEPLSGRLITIACLISCLAVTEHFCDKNADQFDAELQSLMSCGTSDAQPATAAAEFMRELFAQPTSAHRSISFKARDSPTPPKLNCAPLSTQVLTRTRARSLRLTVRCGSFAMRWLRSSKLSTSTQMPPEHKAYPSPNQCMHSSAFGRCHRCDGHFIRCIKPNDERMPFAIEPQMLQTQLQSCGVLEAAKVSQAGFPKRAHRHRASPPLLHREALCAHSRGATDPSMRPVCST